MLNLLYRIRVFSSRLLCRPNNLSITLQQLGLRQNLTILDVGAHKGQTSAYFNKIFPDSILHAFEPSPILFKTLTQNLQNFQNISCHNIALGKADTDGFLSMPSSDLCGQVSLAESTHLKTTKISICSLDSFSTKHKIKEVDILKIDVEGQEIAVLEGAQKLITENSIKVIFLECDFNPDDSQHSFFLDVFHFLTNKNFSFYGLFDLVHYSPAYGVGYCNALFLNRSVFS